MLANGQTVAACDKLIEINKSTSLVGSSGSNLSAEELAQDFSKIAMEESPTARSILATQSPRPIVSRPIRSNHDISEPPAFKRIESSNPTFLPHYAAANEWIAKWSESLPEDYEFVVTRHQLFAYAIWHEQRKDISTIAAISRGFYDEAAVASDVLESLIFEGLPFEKSRLEEITKYLPESREVALQEFLTIHGI